MYKKILKLFLLLVLMNSTLYGALTKTEVSELYVTLMGRVSEGKGSNYWQNNYTNQTEVAKAMLGSDAVAKYFGVSSMKDISNEDFIATIYKNTLNKTVDGSDDTIEDASGIAYWNGRLTGETGAKMSRAEMIVQFITIAQKSTTVSGQQFSNRVEVSNYMADMVETAPNDYKTSTSFMGNLEVTSSRDSVDTAKDKVYNLAYPIYEVYKDTFVYKSNSKYKEKLKECAGYIRHSCYLSTLPLIAQESPTPTKEIIMDRVLVSHKWMGDRFSEMLDILDDDIKQLLGAVTAIVIDDDIRPAYYTTSSGAIYLDPRYLWLTPEEAKTITVRDDSRSVLENGLKFLAYSRYIKDSKYISTFPDALDKNITRTKEDNTYRLAKLLYHELAHANDFVPPSLIDNVDSHKSIYSIIKQHREKNMMLSQQLYQESPLESKALIGLGGVLYNGVNATAEQREMTAEDIGLLFADDSASIMYSYSNPLEDLATLFDAVMMKYHYNIEQDVLFTDKDNIVGWGERNRIAKPNVSDRALFVVKSILPLKTDWDTFFVNGIGKSQLLVSGKGWFKSINLNKDSNKSNKIMEGIEIP